VDENGRQVGEVTVAATPTGHIEALGWARQWPDRQWALENCRHLSRVLERDLLSAGEAVVQVSPKLMGSARRVGRELGKSDPIDALAVARAALPEPHLPVAQLERKSREVKLLVDHREDLVGERIRIQNRLLRHLHELEPGYEVVASGLLRTVVLTDVSSRLENHTGVVAEIARELVCRLAELTPVGEPTGAPHRRTHARAGTSLAEPARLRGVERCRAGCGNRRRQSLSLERSLCHAQRHGSNPGLVWES
jgi:transposase